MLLIRKLIIAIALMVAGSSVAFANANAQLTLPDARHLLSRTGFGASAYQLNQMIGMSRTKAINTIINGLSSTTATPLPDWINQPAPHHWARNQLSKTGRREFNEARYREIESLRLWWTNEMIQTQSPQTERLVLLWHNHFVTGYTGINDQSITIARQHLLFRDLGTGNFRTLLKAIIRDPAILNYLDNDQSRKQSPNENLARELLELFTLGEGNYSESDIKNAARALTGYSTSPVRNLMFQFKPNNHDKSRKVLFGKKGKFNGDDLIDQILAQPAAAEFIAKKFWKTFINDQLPSSDAITPLAKAFRSSDYDIKTLYRAILESDAFWAADNRTSIIRSPVSLTIGTIRSTGIVPDTWQVLPVAIGQLGQQLFDPPNVAGWPGSRAWITPGRLLNRLEWLKSLEQPCADNNCTASDMASMNMMNAPAMQMQTSMIDTDQDQPAELILRMASEEFDGPAIYRVTVTRGDIILWTSGKQPLHNGHNTKRYGRTKSAKDLPWRDVRFTLPENARKFDTVEIEYLNDKNKPGTEQNLFVQWAAFDQQFFDANNGVQTNQCAQRKGSRGGSMLCNGKVRIQGSTQHQKTNTPDNTLAVGKLFFWGVSDPQRKGKKKKFSNVSFTLTDVTLGERYWHALNVRYGYSAKNNTYSLRLYNYGCWSDCVEHWPACTTVSKDESRLQSLNIPLSDTTHSHCTYSDLTEADQQLINTLWKNLPDFYQQTKNNKRLDRQPTHQAYTSWEPHITAIRTLFELHQQNLTSDTEIPANVHLNTTADSPAIARQFSPPRPLAAGRTALQQQSDMQTLISNNPDTTLSTLLLPTLDTQANTAGAALSDVLTDLTYQLK